MNTRAVLLIALCLLALPGFAYADLQNFMNHVNTSYSADAAAFQAGLANRFQVTDVTRRMVILSVDSPADAVICFWLHEQFDVPVSQVLQFYQKQKHHDWTVIATNLGLNVDFELLQTLQRGEIDWQPQLAILN